MNAREHYAESERILNEIGVSANATGMDVMIAQFGATLAQAHATLALFDLLREIGDQLDTAAVVRPISIPEPATRTRRLCDPPDEAIECCASGSCEVCKR